ncbi:MAG: PIG-L family deacetylase [Planctomycetota bacterium]|nr:PIG-L family deacetylase [Planctomycetota bacterium]
MRGLLGPLVRRLKRSKYVNLSSHVLSMLRNDVAIWPEKLEDDDLRALERVLVLTPHPDDEVFGMGGTMVRLRDLGVPLSITWLTNADEPVRKPEARAVLDRLAPEVTDEEAFPLPGEHILVGEATGVIRDRIAAYEPRVIALPSVFDVHIDHVRLVLALRAAITAQGWEGRVLQYEVWNTLVPNAIVDISAAMEEKRELMHLYPSQLRTDILNYVDRIEALNRYRGLGGGEDWAEAFTLTSAEDFVRMSGAVRDREPGSADS